MRRPHDLILWIAATLIVASLVAHAVILIHFTTHKTDFTDTPRGSPPLLPP